MEVTSDGSGIWRCTGYRRNVAIGTVAEVVATQVNMEAASSVTAPVTPGRMIYHPGVAKAVGVLTCASSPSVVSQYNVTSVTDAGVGDYTINLGVTFSATTAMSIGIGSGLDAGKIVKATVLSTSTISIKTYDASLAAEDSGGTVCFQVFGDLA
jgi:hypothetical protein